MQTFVKALISLAIIVVCAKIGRRFPTLGGLIATMPLTSLLVLLWLWSEAPGDYRLMEGYTRVPAFALLKSSPEGYRRFWQRNLRQRRIHGSF